MWGKDRNYLTLDVKVGLIYERKVCVSSNDIIALAIGDPERIYFGFWPPFYLNRHLNFR